MYVYIYSDTAQIFKGIMTHFYLANIMVSTVFLHRYVIHMYRVQCIIDPYLGHTNSLDAKGQ